MPRSIATQWWFPLAVSMHLDGAFQVRGASELSAFTTTQLNKAKQNFELALQSDSQLVAARLNLATTEFFLDSPHAARAHVETVLKHNPDHRHAIGLQAPLLIAQNPNVDVRQQAHAVLASLVDDGVHDLAALYNYARVLDLLGESSNADRAWLRLIEAPGSLPSAFDQTACLRMKLPVNCSLESDSTKTRPIKDNISRYLGESLENAAIVDALTDWSRQTHTGASGRVDIYHSKAGDYIVGLNKRIVFVSRRPDTTQAMSQLLDNTHDTVYRFQLAGAELRQFSKTFGVLTDAPLVREYWYNLAPSE